MNEKDINDIVKERVVTLEKEIDRLKKAWDEIFEQYELTKETLDRYALGKSELYKKYETVCKENLELRIKIQEMQN